MSLIVTIQFKHVQKSGGTQWLNTLFYVHSNLALKYLYHAALEELGDTADHSVVLQEFTINNPMEYVYGELVRGDYDLVCFSVYIWNVEKVKALASKLKQAQGANAIVDTMSATVIKKHNPGMSDTRL